jgi:hypothetical protein
VVSVRAYLRLRAFKGPWIAGVSSIWLVRAVNKGHLHLKTHEVLRKYGRFQAQSPTFLFCVAYISATFVGTIARAAPNLLVTNEVNLLRRMSAARSPYTSADWYDGLRLDPKINNVVSERNDKLHNALRAKISVGVSLLLI